MKRKIVIRLISGLVFLGVIFLSKNIWAVGYQEIVFSELMWMGSNSSYADEWIELKNTTWQNIDLANWQITYLKDNQETRLLKIPSGIIPANGYFLIANAQQNKQYSGGESILALDPDLVDASLTLSNSNLQLKLYNGQWDDGRGYIDIAGDGGRPLKGDSDHQLSMERIFPLDSGNLANSWQNAFSRKNLDSPALEIANPYNSSRPIIKSIFSLPQPLFIKNGETKEIKIEVEITDPDGLVDITQVTADLTSLDGASNQLLYDDNSHGDRLTGDGIYSLIFSFILNNPQLQIGNKNIRLQAVDSRSLISNFDLSLSIYQFSDEVIINEIQPRPESASNDEFIELYNRGNDLVNLFGWQLDDEVNESSSLYKLDGSAINAKSYLVLTKTLTKISLDDSGDIVRLLNPLGTEQAVVRYAEKPEKNWTYNLTASGWVWSTDSSYGRENNVNKPLEAEVVPTVSLAFNKNQNNKSLVKKSSRQSLSDQSSRSLSGQNSAPKKTIANQSANELLRELVESDLLDDNLLQKQLFWIKFTQYVIMFTIVICIIVLSQILFTETTPINKSSKL